MADACAVQRAPAEPIRKLLESGLWIPKLAAQPFGTLLKSRPERKGRHAETVEELGWLEDLILIQAML